MKLDCLTLIAFSLLSAPAGPAFRLMLIRKFANTSGGKTNYIGYGKDVGTGGREPALFQRDCTFGNTRPLELANHPSKSSAVR